MDKETFVKLAQGYIRQESYEDEFRDLIYSLAGKHGQEKDFLGLPLGTSKIMNPVLDILGDDFAYFHYDCKDSFEKFNDNNYVNNTKLADDSHPNVHSLEDLYDFAKEQGSIQ